MAESVVRISVIVCTYNPDDKVFIQCLDNIREASDHYTPHEVLIIDNNSSTPVADRDYVKEFASYANVNVIREKEQGLTPSRLRGINDSSGDLLIFVDDDNFIDRNYFRVAADIYTTHDHIGAYSGQVSLQYDHEPEKWTKRYWGMLIYRQLDRDLWSNQYFNNDTMPNGAGLCVTREVAGYYAQLFADGKRSFQLDRSEGSLMSGGDNDLAMCACDIGKGMGLFTSLHLRHYIPASRFTIEYLSKLAYGIYFSFVILQYMRLGKFDRHTLKEKIKHLISISVMKTNDRIIQRSCKRGVDDALKMIEERRLKVA